MTMRDRTRLNMEAILSHYGAIFRLSNQLPQLLAQSGHGLFDLCARGRDVGQIAAARKLLEVAGTRKCCAFGEEPHRSLDRVSRRRQLARITGARSLAQ